MLSWRCGASSPKPSAWAHPLDYASRVSAWDLRTSLTIPRRFLNDRECAGGMGIAMKIRDSVFAIKLSPVRPGARVVMAMTCVLFSMATSAYAADPPAIRVDPNAVKAPKPSGLTGDLRAQCIAGTYPASNMCKPAPPGFYAPPNTVYPVRCPDGKSSNYGARGTSECF